MDYVLCADKASLDQVTTIVKLCTHIILDCEGKNLGQQDGSLSLISLRTITPKISPTYLIDTLSFTRDELRPLFDSIESPELTKIVFDGRMDFSELYNGYDITLRGALDIQLADILSRPGRGENTDRQLSRLSPYIYRPNVRGQPNCYFSVQMLLSLYECLKEHGIDTKERLAVDHSLWLERPLPEKNLQYASQDIQFIGLLYEYFKRKGYLDGQLLEKSTRYVSLWKDAKPQKMDKFRNHPLLPLQVIDYDHPSCGGPTRICTGCRRSFSKKAYSILAWKVQSKRYCWVCHAIMDRKHMDDLWERDRENSYDYDGWDSTSDGFGGYSS